MNDDRSTAGGLIRLLDDAERRAGESRWKRLGRHPIRVVRGKCVKAINRHPRLGELPTEAHAFFGVPLWVYPPETVSESVLRYGYFESALTRSVCMVVRPGDRVFDVGAHLGYFTTLFATLVGEQGSVLAFEPTPSTRRTLVRNVGSLPQVRVLDEAAWSGREALTLRDFGVCWSSFNSAFEARAAGVPRGQTFEVTTVTLDEVAEREGMPDFVKIDAESAEGHILQGMQEILRVGRPVVSLEVGDAHVPGAMSSRSLLAAVVADGYTAVEAHPAGFVEVALADDYSYENVLLVPTERLGTGEGSLRHILPR